MSHSNEEFMEAFKHLDKICKEIFNSEPKAFTSHDGEWVVPEGDIFVSGDNREGSNSYDSRSGLGTVPLYKIIGPVSFRLFPFDKIRTFNYQQK